MSEETAGDNILLPHHVQQELCTTRSPYRQGKKLTAVKVYTTNNESRHLLLFGIPAINIKKETKKLCSRFGTVRLFNVTNKYKSEKFTETYHLIYENIKQAKIAKRKLDNKTFYGESLHVCYAPELESIEETRDKLQQRNNDVLNRLRNLQSLENKKAKKAIENKQKVKGEVKVIKVKDVKDIQKIKRGEIKKVNVKVSDVKGMVVKKVKAAEPPNAGIKTKCSTSTKDVVTTGQQAINSNKVSKKIVVLKKFTPDQSAMSTSDSIVLSNSSDLKMSSIETLNLNAPQITSNTLVLNDMSNNMVTSIADISNSLVTSISSEMSNAIATTASNVMTNISNENIIMVSNDMSNGMVSNQLSDQIIAVSHDISSTVANSILITSGNSMEIECNVDKTVVSMNQSLNYNNFGTEIILAAPQKDMNTIVYHPNEL